MHKQSIKLVIESKKSNLDLLGNAIQGICKSIINDENFIYNMMLCVIETVTNVIVHAYHERENELVEINVILKDHFIVFEILDTGDVVTLPNKRTIMKYNPKEIESLPESGIGLYLVYTLMDEVTFSQNAEGKNLLTMKKKY